MSSADRYLCSIASRDRDEPVFGTASRVDRWLLVESSGPWGQRALPQSRGLDDAVLLPLQQRAKQAHVRLLLMRRPGRSTGSGVREVIAADSRPGYEFLLRRRVTTVDDLVDLPFPYDGELAGWEPRRAFIGVCTQGRHDPCCAVMGRPVATALASSHPELTYEISHVGGDRFAANVLVLPGGHYLGQVPPAEASRAVDQLLSGEVPTPYYRGRSAWPMAAQAAQRFAADELGVRSLDALRPHHIELTGPRQWRVRLAGDVDVDGRRDNPVAAGEIVVELEQDLSGEPVRLTCHATADHPPPAWRLRGLVSTTERLSAS